jgi:hypothetical protein
MFVIVEESQRNVYPLTKRWEIESETTIIIHSEISFNLQWFPVPFSFYYNITSLILRGRPGWYKSDELKFDPITCQAGPSPVNWKPVSKDNK